MAFTNYMANRQKDLNKPGKSSRFLKIMNGCQSLAITTGGKIIF